MWKQFDKTCRILGSIFDNETDAQSNGIQVFNFDIIFDNFGTFFKKTFNMTFIYLILLTNLITNLFNNNYTNFCKSLSSDTEKLIIFEYFLSI